MSRFSWLWLALLFTVAGAGACDDREDAADIEEADPDVQVRRAEDDDEARVVGEGGELERPDGKDDADDAMEAAEDNAEDARENDVEDAADDVGDVVDDAEEDVRGAARDVGEAAEDVVD